MVKTLVGTLDPPPDVCEICGQVSCICLENYTRYPDCPDNNPHLIPNVPIAAVRDMIAWFPKDKYTVEEDEDGFIVYSKPTKD